MMAFNFEYFYGTEAEKFSFYRIPKILFKNKFFKDVSAEAKVLYGLMLDRTGLSVKNGWIDEENRVYIIYTIAEIMEELNCADQKAGKLLSELDAVKGIGLIERKRQGLGRPNIIYVKNFCSIDVDNHYLGKVKITSQEILESRLQKSENHDSRKVNITNQEYLISSSNNTNINNTEYTDTEINNPILSYPISEEKYDESVDAIGWRQERKIYEKIIKSNIEYDIMVERFEKV